MRELPPERWQQIDDLFAAALEHPPAERRGFLASACGNDLELLSEVLQARGELDAAESLYRQALAISREVGTADRHRLAIPLGHLAGLLRERGACAEAEPLYREGLALLGERFPPGHPRLAEARDGLEACLRALGRPAEAAAATPRARIPRR
jgi:tetratricopeptide (TPR) repeat protein